MMTIITCTGCGKDGGLPVELELEYKVSNCGHCGQTDRKTWKYWFCTVECMIKWIEKNDVAKVGVPCKDCFSYDVGGPTGYFCGFKQNGICKTCRGKKVVKVNT